ncbi:hypothetical protein [Kitasatospora sp. NPDC093806]|uniref:hypothetical protein n=1 Tax=Kitasatospora sp. NPDC093806 TaxID=3155075 RepID=UPI00341C7F28
MTSPHDAPVPADVTVATALHTATRFYEGPEHVRVHGSRAGARGVMFVIAPNPDTARDLCLAVCARAIAGTPELTGWFAHA